MSFLITAVGFSVIVFLVSYFRSGRYGITALSMAAGYVFSIFWVRLITKEYEYVSDGLTVVGWDDLVYSLVVLIPAIMAILLSEKRGSLLPRIVASLATALMAVALLLSVLASVSGGDTSQSIAYKYLAEYQNLIITGALILALFDAIMSRSAKPPKR